MLANSLETRRSFLVAILSVIALLAFANLYLQWSQSGFWDQPQPLNTKLGVAGYEIVVLFLLASVCVLPAYLLAWLGFRRMSRWAAVLLILPLLLVMIVSWSFYEHFHRFVGAYAIQMMLQDGGQLVEFVGKMPSAVNWQMVGGFAGLLIAMVSLLVLRDRFLRFTRMVMAGVCVGLLLASVGVSSLWNRPVDDGIADASNLKETLVRVRESEFAMLSDRSGPFSELARGIAGLWSSGQESFAIDTNMLRQITDDEPVLKADIKPYNVVFMVVESLHPDVLVPYGSGGDVMPTVNTLAENALVFERAYAQASHSNYADVSALSGQYPLRSMNIHFYPKESSYPKSLPYERLAPYGYRSGLFSSQNEKWGQMSYYLDSPALDVFSHVGSERADTAEKFQGIQVTDYDDSRKMISYGDFMYQSAENNIERLDGETTDDALAWLDTLERDTPFFMYFNFQASHSPFNALPPNYQRVFYTEEGEQAERMKRGDINGLPVAHSIRAYWDALHYVDQNIARVVNELKQTGRHDNTIYVVTADTSIRFGSSIIGNGGDLYPDVLQIPIIMAIPGVEGTQMISEPVEQIDIMPTVLGAIGVGPHPASQGVNVLEHRDEERV